MTAFQNYTDINYITLTLGDRPPNSRCFFTTLNLDICRVNQRFLLATSTKVDVSGVKVPASINDKYFARYIGFVSCYCGAYL